METYEQIAKSADLSADMTQRYLMYMRSRRWEGSDEATQCADGYALEWAHRFRSGYEYLASDKHGQALLRSQHPGRYGAEDTTLANPDQWD